MTFSGWVALVAGWYVTEIGRQPWLVSGLLATSDAISAVPAERIGLTLAMYLALYLFLLVAFVAVVFHLARKAGGDDKAKDLNPAANPFRVKEEGKHA
jgi:cytochrome d ubiquinol oxidase subunit I